MKTIDEMKNYLEERLEHVRKEEGKARDFGDNHMAEVWYGRNAELVATLEYLEK